MTRTHKAHSASANKPQSLYNAIWRWHFYAGLFCIPFALWLSVTGAIYLFKPQIDSWLDSSYDNIVITGERATPKAQVEAALAAVPGSVLNAYILPQDDHSAVRVLAGKDKELYRVYIHPQTLEVMKIDEEDQRFMRMVFLLHGELMLGDKGSMLMELAASWMIVLIITGLYLWWPRGTGLAGSVYPRLSRGSRTFWRDMHAVTGLWVSFFLLFLLVSGLPWAKSWGGMLKQVRQLGQTAQITQDWSTGRSSELAERKAGNTPTMSDGGGEHSGHGGHQGHHMPIDLSILNQITTIVSQENLAPPVLISPPSMANAAWSARSDTQNRPLRASLKLDSKTGAIVERKDFSQKPLLDRIIGTGVAAHEGQLFGWFNQALGVFTAVGVIAMTVSAIVMWWARRPANTLGAPRRLQTRRIPLLLGMLIVCLGIVLPLLGASLITILIVEFLALRRFESTRRFLGVG